jgi:hypothetical protein
MAGFICRFIGLMIELKTDLAARPPAATKEVDVGNMSTNSAVLNLQRFRRPFQGL